jgi:hypothetical protein
MIFNNAMADRQPEPRSVCLCGKKKVKIFFDITCGNAAALVGNLDMYPTLHRIYTALDSDRAAIINSIHRIEQEINKYKNLL